VALALLDPFSSRAEALWRELEETTQIYFLRWAWIENWLALLPRRALPRLAVVERDGAPVAAGFLTRRRVLRHGVVPSRALYLNTTGDPALDDIWIEHNHVLGDGALADLIAALPRGWDELYVPATDEALVPGALPPDLTLKIDREVTSHHVDLDQVRSRGYPALLGSSTRAQLRRAERRAGELTVEIPRDADEALAMFDELVVLHQRRWEARGMPGAFADPWFRRFHRRLITRRYATGEIQLLRVRNRAGTIGCLYNFVCGGRVLFYQCGFAMPEHPHDKPGYICHARAIEHSAAAGHAIYDMLGGDARYKANLATDATRLVWLRVQRKRPWFALEDLATRALRSWRARSSS
jgi:CelD/BcsL family acetyltransferase involved in cellulose biosynthesis